MQEPMTSQSGNEDPVTLLSSDSSDDPVHRVVVTDKGSQTHRAGVVIQGVPPLGVVDIGAEITIVGDELLQKVASANRLNKSRFKHLDKTPRTYDQQVVKLNGRM